MCWFFDGLVLVKSSSLGSSGDVLYHKREDMAFYPCPEPDHTFEKAPARHNLPLDFQWKICAWAAKRVGRLDPETAARFEHILKHGLSMGHDQSIFEKYRLRVRIGYQVESRPVQEKKSCRGSDYAENLAYNDEI